MGLGYLTFGNFRLYNMVVPFKNNFVAELSFTSRKVIWPCEIAKATATSTVFTSEL